MGCRQLIVREKAVTSEPLGLDSELTEAKGHKKENGARGGKLQEQPPPKKQRVA